MEFSPEDASRTELDFLAQVVEAVIEAGATTVNIPDTVGYTVPDEFAELFRYLRKNVRGIDKIRLSVHCHDDLGMAVANSLTAVVAGARQIECTINGIGERAGNCSLEEVVMALKTRDAFFNLDTGINTTRLYPTSRMLSNIIGMPIPRNKAVVGENAFAHESGIHQHGMLKHHSTYEIMRPEDVGLSRSALVLGKHSGRHALRERVKELGFELDEVEFAPRVRGIQGARGQEEGAVRRRHRGAGAAGRASRRRPVVAGEPAHRVRQRARRADATVQPARTAMAARSRCTPPATVRWTRRSRPSNAPPACSVVLRKFEVRSVSAGEDAQGEALVYVEYNQRTYRGSSVSTNIVESATQAFLEVINRIELAQGTSAHARGTDRCRARRAGRGLKVSGVSVMPIPATKYIWFNGKLVPWEKATVHVLSHALHYGSSVFEGVRAYETPRGPAIFRLRDHTRRLFDSAKIYRINMPVHRRPDQSRLPRSHLAERPGARRLPAPGGVPRLWRNRRRAEDRSAGGSGHRRLGMGQVSRRAPKMKASTCACRPGSAWRPTPFPPWPRPAATTCRASSSASRPSASASSKASASSADGTVSEGAGENLFLVKDGVLYTPGVAHSLLDGITRHTVMHAREGPAASKCARSRSRARCSTSPTNCSSPAPPPRSPPSARWTPSRSATASAVRSPQKLQAAYFGLVQGKTQDKCGWLDYVDMTAPGAPPAAAS